MTNPVQIDVEAAVIAVCSAYDVFADACIVNHVEINNAVKVELQDTMIDLVTADSDVPFAFRVQSAQFAFSRSAALVTATHNTASHMPTDYRKECGEAYKGILAQGNLKKFYQARLNTLNRLSDRVYAKASISSATAKKPSAIR